MTIVLEKFVFFMTKQFSYEKKKFMEKFFLMTKSFFMTKNIHDKSFFISSTLAFFPSSTAKSGFPFFTTTKNSFGILQ